MMPMTTQADSAPLFTVCTPTFNRARFLAKVHDTLSQQTLKDFEWLVVDDGSTDNTREVVESFAKEGRVSIRYFWKANGGKHTALNLAVRQARGSCFTVVDSDDWFEPSALERMKFHWEQISPDQRSRYKGVCGLFAYESGEIVGDKFPSDRFDVDDLDLQLRYNVDGDKIGFTRIEVMREFPFPEDLSDGVNGVIYISESLVWNRMGRKYITRFVNEVFGIKEYQQGGITDRGRLIQARNSKAALLNVFELITCGRRLPFRHAVRAYSNYVRHSLHERIPLQEQMARLPEKSRVLACYPIGIFLFLRDRRLFRAAAAVATGDPRSGQNLSATGRERIVSSKT